VDIAFVNKKLALARALANEEHGGDYTDASLITAAIVSGIASDLWEGRGIDRDRFIEVWARDADPGLNPNLVSVPLLRDDLQPKALQGDIAALEAVSALETARPEIVNVTDTLRVLSGSKVDMDEGEVVRICPSLLLTRIRAFSYSSIYYEQVRCATSHEYQLGPLAAAQPMDADADVSYVNRLVKGRVMRLIHFHPRWLDDIVRSIATSVEPDTMAGRQRPKVWWTGEALQ